MKRILKSIINKFVKPCIIFESRPDFSDNTKPVYDELLRRGYQKKYNLFWYIDDETYAVFYNGKPIYWKLWDYSTLKNRLYNMSFQKEKKALIICNRFITPYPINDSKKSFYLMHGTTLKDTSGYYTVPNNIDYCISTSEYVRKVMAYSLSYDINRIIPLGYPRNDVFIQPTLNIKAILKTQCDKIVVWYPTFKQSKGGMKTGCDNAIPIIYDKNNAEKLNFILQNTNLLIVLKPHFAQDLAYIKDLHLSNIRFINDQFFIDNCITSYQFVASCDALLTDYSSIYSDFLLSNKPVGLIWEDIEQYKKCPGLCPEYELMTEGINKIYNLDNLVAFLNDVVNEKDNQREQRYKLRDLLNISTDGNNTQRVVDFIVEKAQL